MQNIHELTGTSSSYRSLARCFIAAALLWQSFGSLAPSQAQSPSTSLSIPLPNGVPTPEQPFVNGLIYSSPYITLSLCYDSQPCRILVFDSTHSPLHTVAERDFPQGGSIQSNTHLQRGPHNTLRFGSFGLALPDLEPAYTLPEKSFTPSTDGEDLGFPTTPNAWCVLHLGSTDQCARSGSGVLLATGFGSALVRENSSINYVDLKTGTSRRIAATNRCPATGRILEYGTLAIASCGDTELYDTSGRRLTSLKGLILSFDPIQMSSSDGRVLSLDLRNQVSTARRADQTALALVTLGAGATDEIPNTGVLRVRDIRTGRICFESTLHFKTPNEQPSVAISEDGEHVAVAGPEELRLYDLPAACAVAAQH